MPSFLYPAFLIGAAAAAVPIVLHLFRRQTEREVSFSAVRFLRRAPVEQARSRRLRELLLLALRVAALILLALAFARPYFARRVATDTAPVTIVAVDRSFSMSAPGQFERARQLARDAANGAPANHLVGLVAFADAADLIVPPSPGRAAVLAGVDRLRTGFGGTRYSVALARAAEGIGGHAGRIVVVTDLQQSGWQAGDRGSVPARVKIDVADSGAPPSNLAVVDLRAEADGPVALVNNSGVTLRSGRAWLRIGGTAIVDVPFTVAPGRSTEVRLTADLPANGVAAVTIDDDIGYVADNTRYLLLDPPEPTNLLAVTANASTSTDAFYLERALLIGGGASRFGFASVSAASLSGPNAEDLGRSAMVLLLGTRGLDQTAREALHSYVAGGGGLLAVGGPDLEPAVLEDLLRPEIQVRVSAATVSTPPLTFAPTDARHPIFRPFGSSVGNLGAVRFARTIHVIDEGGGRVIARFSSGAPALLEYRSGAGRILLFGSDLNNRWNDFPLQPSFVPFVHELARYVTATRASPREYLIGELPPGLAPVPGPATLPRGASRRGLSALTAGGSAALTAGRRVVVNVDPRESDPSRIPPDRFMAAITRLNDLAAVEAMGQAQDQEERQRLWQYGLALMVVGLLIEGVLGSRMG